MTPGMPFMEVSIGNVTSCSTSCGASPSASVRMLTVGRLMSGNTSIGMRGSMNSAVSDQDAAAARTNRRLRKLVCTMSLNIWLLADLVDEICAAHDDPIGGIKAGCDDYVFGIEWLYPDGSRLETFRGDMHPDDALAVVALHHGIARKDQTLIRPAALDEHGDGLADAKARKRFRNGEMNHGACCLRARLVPR